MDQIIPIQNLQQGDAIVGNNRLGLWTRFKKWGSNVCRKVAYGTKKVYDRVRAGLEGIIGGGLKVVGGAQFLGYRQCQ